jgi:putative MATE family efflux protein
MMKQHKFFNLFIIILIETGLFMLMGIVDTMMLSAYDDFAVAAVGLANQSLNLANMLFLIVSTGTIIVLSQYLGAKRFERANNIALTSILFAFLLGLTLSVIFISFDDFILGLLNVDAEIYDWTKSYMNIVTFMMAINAMNPVLGSIFRGFEKAKYSLYISLMANIINIVGNAVFIFGLFGLPQLGVVGVAYSTATAIAFRALVSILVLIFGLKIKPTLGLIKNFFKFMREIIKVGTPSALENGLYTIMQFVVVSIVSSIGNTEVTTRIYILNISMFIYLASMAFAQTNQIYVGNYVGAKQPEEAFKITNWSFKYSLITAIIMTIVANIFGGTIIGWFTNNPDVIRLGRQLLMISLFVETGRALNLVYQSALKGSGDVYFPLITAAIFMIGMCIPVSYLLGITFNLGLIGVWIAYALDECSRGIIAIIYWYKKKWVNKAIVQKSDEIIEQELDIQLN